MVSLRVKALRSDDWARWLNLEDFAITSNYLKHTRTIEEVYDLIEKDRVAAAEAARLKFLGDVESAIAAVSEISTVAGAKIAADSQIASAKILIDAEVSATRLLSEAERRAAQCINASLGKPREIVESMLLEISRGTAENLSAAANDSVAKIKLDAETAIQNLKAAGAKAILEIQALSTQVEDQLNIDAKAAADRLKKFRERPRATEEIETEADQACRLVTQAASEGAASLREAVDQSFVTIDKITEDACAAIQESAHAAERRISQGQALALSRLDDLIAVSRKRWK